MALVRAGGGVSEISGSIGGTTFARNRGGAYARNRTTPLNPKSAAQTIVRAGFASLATRWATVLTGSQRDAWSEWAANVPVPNRLGEDRFLTGLQTYIKSNALLQLIGATLADNAPVSFTAGPTLEPVYAIDEAAQTYTVTNLGGYDPATDGIVGIVFSISRPVNPGVNFFQGPFVQAAASIYATLAALPTADALPVTLGVGQKTFIRCAPVLPDGRVGVPVITPFLVA